MDVENGQEVRPHHYIGSIRPDGPVGMNGRLKTNDELLEVQNFVAGTLSSLSLFLKLFRFFPYIDVWRSDTNVIF